MLTKDLESAELSAQEGCAGESALRDAEDCHWRKSMPISG